MNGPITCLTLKYGNSRSDMEHVGIRIDELRRQCGMDHVDLWVKSKIPSMRLHAIVHAGAAITVDEAIALEKAFKTVSARDLLIYQVHQQLDHREQEKLQNC